MHILEDSLGFQVNMTANAMKNRFNAFLKPYGLTSEQYVIMKSIHENPDISPTQLAQITFKDKTTLTRMIQTMVKHDLLVRLPKDEDKRAYRLQWSQKGEKIMQSILPQTHEIISHMRQQIDPLELEIFLKILDQLKQISPLEEYL
jgi:DNA-binding MarR family transcriptional regulator